jgi:ABC-type transport system substrate-binding protein
MEVIRKKGVEKVEDRNRRDKWTAILDLAVLPMLCLSLFLWVIGSSLAIAAPQPGGDLVVAVPIEPDTFDPHKAVAAATKEIDFNIYQGLVSYDPEGRIIPCLAESWDISEDGRVYTFRLLFSPYHGHSPILLPN